VSSQGCDSVAQFNIAIIPPNSSPSLSYQAYNSVSYFPNPFTSKLKIDLFLAMSDQVQISLHDLMGSRVALIHNGRLNKGNHLFEWDGTMESDYFAPAGLYICRIQCAGAPGFQQIIFRN